MNASIPLALVCIACSGSGGMGAIAASGGRPSTHSASPSDAGRNAADPMSATAGSGAPGQVSGATAPLGPFRFGMSMGDALALCQVFDPQGTLADCAADPVTAPFGASRLRLTFLNGGLTVVQYEVDSPLAAGLMPYAALRSQLRERYGRDAPLECPFACVDPDCLDDNMAFETLACQPNRRLTTMRTWLGVDHAAQLRFSFRAGSDADLAVVVTLR